MTHIRHTDVSIHDVARQAAWELDGINRAVERYRQMLETQEASERVGGRTVLKETVPAVVQLLEQRLDGVLSETGRGRPEAWSAPLASLSPDVLAVIAVAVGLRVKPVEHTTRFGQRLTAYSHRVAEAIRDQYDYEAWVKAQEDAAKKQSKEERREDPADALLQRFRRVHPKADTRSWRAWRKRVDAARSEPWDEPQAMSVGGLLATTLAEAAPRWFILEEFGNQTGANRPICLMLTAYATERMAEAEERASVGRPMMLPMLIPPLDWRYTNTQQEKAQ